jgi:hypothetical protein
MVHTFSPLQERDKRFPTVVPVLVVAVLLALTGCASVPPPDGAMNQAQAQLQAARDAGASDYDPVDFGFAQDKFQQAQAAMADRKYDVAGNLADESRADANLARTKALLGQARAQIQSKTDANSQLRSQNAEAQSENDQHYQQLKAQLAAQQAAMQQSAGDNGDNGDNPASGSSAPGAPASSQLPSQAPVQQDMPAPSSSVLGNPQQGGFQTQPDNNQQNQQPSPNQPDAGQPNQGGQP